MRPPRVLRSLRMMCLPVFLFLQSCNIASYDAPKERAEIKSLLDDQVASWNKGDLDGYMRGYWKSDSLIFTSSGFVFRGWDSTLQKYKAAYATDTAMGTVEFSNLDIQVLSAGSAWVFGNWALRNPSGTPHGVFTLVLKKLPEGWRVVHDHTSNSR